MFSPHAWGCSVYRCCTSAGKDVLPTRVGMFRFYLFFFFLLFRSPHTRGDVPASIGVIQADVGFSPHAWGCSVTRLRPLGGLEVLPTRVGMFRRRRQPERLQDGSPHTRGDVPGFSKTESRKNSFSPHAWGCSVCSAPRQCLDFVLPTRVGMFRFPRWPPPGSRSSPHTRGDVPFLPLIRSFGFGFSPHAWGCSVPLGETHFGEKVLPTRVGMFRKATNAH